MLFILNKISDIQNTKTHNPFLLTSPHLLVLMNSMEKASLKNSLENAKGTMKRYVKCVTLVTKQND